MALALEYKLLKWGYSDFNGPKAWHCQYPIAANGKRQSPIDIDHKMVKPDPNLSPVKATYQDCEQLDLENTGKSWQLHFHDPYVSSLSGGPLHGEYKIVQMHAHWGCAEGHGSEHTIDGVPYDAELHIVHYNAKYCNPGEAFDKEDGLAVLGMLIKVGQEHPEFNKLLHRFEELEEGKDVTRLDEHLNPGNFLPPSKNYFTYPGSLTTPPLYESVTWILFQQPIEVSQKQLDTMRSLKTGSEKKKKQLVNNFRPPCPLASREIRLHAN